MPDVQDAAPSAAPAVTAEPSFVVPRSGPEYDTWRKTGALPEKKVQPTQPADPAPADTSKETPSAPAEVEPAPEPESGKQTQERRKPGAEHRIGELTAQVRQLQRELEEVRRPKPTQAESSPARPQQPQTYADYRKAFKPSDWIAAYAQQNPDASYEEANAAMADHLYDVRRHFETIEQRVNQERQALESKVTEAKNRYENFDQIKSEFLSHVVSEQGTPLIPLPVLGIINDSDVLPDLLYTIGSDSAEMQKFVEMAKTNPNKAIRYVTRVEELIQQELSKPRNENGQFTSRKTEPEPAPAPAKRGPESAPEPPIEINQRGGLMDESDRALKDAERGNSKAFRLWKEAEDRKELARRRGA